MQALSQLSYTPLQNRNEIIWTYFAVVNSFLRIGRIFLRSHVVVDARPRVDAHLRERRLDARHDDVAIEQREHRVD